MILLPPVLSLLGPQTYIVAIVLLALAIQTAAGYDSLPDSHETWDHRSSGLRKIVDDWISDGTAKAAVQTTYGPIEEWDMSSVANMDSLFLNKTTNGVSMILTSKKLQTL